MEKIQGRPPVFHKLRSIKLNSLVLNTLFTIALLIMILISFLSYKELSNLMNANKWVTHTYEVIQTIDASLFSLSEIESDQRSYLITGERHFLSEVDGIKSELGENLERLSQLTHDYSEQNQRVIHLDKLIENRLTLLTQVGDLKAEDKLYTPEGLALFNRSNEFSSQAKAAGQEIKSIELALLKERNTRMVNEASFIRVLILGGGIFSLCFLFIPFILANIELANRKKVESKNENTQTHLRQIIESTNDMIAALDNNNCFQIFNEAYQREFKRFFGKSLTIGMSMDEALSEVNDSRNPLLKTWKHSLQPSNEITILEFNSEQGKLDYELIASEIKDEHNVLKGIVHNMKDITNRVKEHAELQTSYKKLAEGMKELQIKNEQITLLVDMSDIMLASNSLEELAKILSKFANQLLSFSNGYLYIMHPSKNYLEQSAKWGNPKQQEAMFTPEQCWAIRLGRKHQICTSKKDLLCEHISVNEKTPANIICLPLMAQNDIYGLLYLEIVQSSFTLSEEQGLIVTAFAELTALALANVRLRENLRYQSIRDPLTGLYNRRYLEDALFKQTHQAERSKFNLALLMLDLDHFKKINDTYGHDAGDNVLKEVGDILQDAVRAGDIAARFGGEEFILMFHNIDSVHAKKRAEEIRSNVLKLQIKYGAQPISPTTVSIGIAMYPNDSKDTNELIENADKALYWAKKNGRNQVALFSELKKVN